jgi:serine/threonine-protein kinase HipA
MTPPVEVWLYRAEQNLLVGTAHFTIRRGHLTTVFSYADSYLQHPVAFALDPSLPLDAGGGTVSGLPGSFADATPDRWGRRLLTRSIRATEGVTGRLISDVDFLLGVSDETRQGALRFRGRDTDAVAAAGTEVPKMIRLPELMRAADAVARDPDDFAPVKVLLDAGTGTLGGARPKASVTDGKKLFIAKFGHHHDEWDVMAWEKTALDLAGQAGLTTPRRKLARIAGKSVLLVERFDREPAETPLHRIPYISAMSMLQGTDGDPHDYLDLVEEISTHSDGPELDLRELWRRLAFNALINNTDDHMRNHGFLRGRRGWHLSPLFDVNPNPDSSVPHASSINGATSREESLAQLISQCAFFALKPREAREGMADLKSVVARWPDVARNNGVEPSEISSFIGAFDV